MVVALSTNDLAKATIKRQEHQHQATRRRTCADEHENQLTNHTVNMATNITITNNATNINNSSNIYCRYLCFAL